MSTPSQVLMLVFLGTVVVGAISANPVWIAVALVVFPAGSAAYVLDWHRHRKGGKAVYDRNVAKHGSAFATPPLTLSADELPDLATFKLYSNDTAEYLCTLSRPQLQELISKHQEWGLDANEFLIMGETIDKLEEEGGHSRLTQLLREMLGKRGSIEIRWTLE